MRRLTLLAVAVLLLVGLGVLSGVVTRGLGELEAARAEQRDLERRKAQLEREISSMKETLHRLESDPEAVESVARRDLGWIRPGDEVILLTTPTPEPRPTPAASPAPTPLLRLPR